MRRIGHLSRALLLLTVGIWVAQWAWALVTAEFAALKVDRQITDAQATVTYLLETERWTEFAVTGHGEAIRVLSTANVPAGTQNPDEDPLTYALAYQLINRSGDIIDDRVYYQRTRLPELVDAQGRAFVPYFYQGVDLVPARSQRLMINFQGMERPAKLRLRLAATAPPVTDVTVRVYERAGTLLGTSARHFERLTQRQQQLLGAASVYGAGLLRDEEKLRLMSSTWEPSGPTGVLGQDYQERRLYVVSEHGGMPPTDEVVPSGLYLDAARRVRIPLPHSEGRIRLRIQPIGAAPQADSDSLTLHWTGSRSTGWRSFSAPVRTGEIIWEEALGAGWLEATATFAATVTAYLVDAQGEQDITPELRYQRMYIAAAGAPVVYRVDHLRGATTPFRIDVRVEEPPFVSASWARYQLRSADGRIIDEGRLEFDTQPSEYDRGTGPLPYPTVSDPHRFYFKLTAEVAEVLILAEQPVLVSAYTRPLHSPYAIRVPAAYDAYLRDRDDTAAPPAWFSIRPTDSNERIRTQRSRLLAVQSKPRSDAAPTAVDDFDWTDFFPSGTWLARHVLNPRDPTQTVSDRAHSAVFNQLTLDRTIRLRIVAEANRALVEPTLIYLRDKGSPFSATIHLDGQPVITTQLSGMRGELRLPPIATGSHTLRVSGDRGVSWFINHTDLRNSTVTRRLAYRLFDSSGLRFYYTKESADDETLSARVQLPRGATYPARVRVTLDLPRDHGDLGPFPGLTLRERVFEITGMAGSESVPVMGSDQFADLGHTLFVAFGSELPPGEYPVSIALQTPGEAYLSLYRRRPGRRPEHRLFFDTAGGPE